jgi:hypothetical protein
VLDTVPDPLHQSVAAYPSYFEGAAEEHGLRQTHPLWPGPSGSVPKALAYVFMAAGMFTQSVARQSIAG